LGAAVVVTACMAGVAGATGAGAPTCAPGSVKLALDPNVSPMTGEHLALFQLTNRSRRSCVLDGYPRVSIRDDGKRLPFRYRNGGGPYVTKWAPQRVTLGPERHAYFLVAQYRCDGAILYTATSIRVLLPGATRAVIVDLAGQGVAGLNYCKRYPGDQPIDPGNRVTVSPVEAPGSSTSSLP
jgi:hypothetical protein